MVYIFFGHLEERGSKSLLIANCRIGVRNCHIPCFVFDSIFATSQRIESRFSGVGCLLSQGDSDRHGSIHSDLSNSLARNLAGMGIFVTTHLWNPIDGSGHGIAFCTCWNFMLKTTFRATLL